MHQANTWEAERIGVAIDSAHELEGIRGISDGRKSRTGCSPRTRSISKLDGDNWPLYSPQQSFL